MKAIDGPWEIGHDNNGTPIVTFEARDICTVETYFGDGEEIARLIKNAPALVDALKGVIAAADAIARAVPTALSGLPNARELHGADIAARLVAYAVLDSIEHGH